MAEVDAADSDSRTGIAGADAERSLPRHPPENPVEGDRYADEDGDVWEFVEHDYDDGGHWTIGEGKPTHEWDDEAKAWKPLEQSEQFVEDCTTCGEPIDYCQGHGELG